MSKQVNILKNPDDNVNPNQPISIHSIALNPSIGDIKSS